MVVGMVFVLSLCGNGLRKGYHAAYYGQVNPAFHRPCVVIIVSPTPGSVQAKPQTTLGCAGIRVGAARTRIAERTAEQGGGHRCDGRRNRFPAPNTKNSPARQSARRHRRLAVLARRDRKEIA